MRGNAHLADADGGVDLVFSFVGESHCGEVLGVYAYWN